MNDSIFDFLADGTRETSYGQFLLIIGVSIGLGVLISLVYYFIYRKKVSQSFVLTLVILPPIVTAIIYFVGNSIASAFSLAGAFAIIRFRSEPGDTKDIAYILFIMAVGLACGMGYIYYAMILAGTLCVLVAAIELLGYAKPKLVDRVLKITLSENMEFNKVFDDIFEKYTSNHALSKIKTTELGSLYVAEFDLSLKNGIDEKAFIDELRSRNGNLSISLMSIR